MSTTAKIILTVFILVIGGFIIVELNVAMETGSHPVGIIFVMGMAAGITAIWKKKPGNKL